MVSSRAEFVVKLPLARAAELVASGVAPTSTPVAENP